MTVGLVEMIDVVVDVVSLELMLFAIEVYLGAEWLVPAGPAAPEVHL